MQTVDVFFDYASPWAYLLSELAEKKLPGVPLVWRPIYIRGLEPFTNGLPYGSLKLAYVMRDLERVAKHEGVKITPPQRFPIDALHALRGTFLAQETGAVERYRRAIFRAAWREARDISQLDIVLDILTEATGTTFEPAALATSEIKTRLREATSAAIDKGVFGVPTFAVGDELFWGIDRADYVLRAASI